MRATSLASVAGPLTDRLNALRVQRGSRLGIELDQVRFVAQGLRNSDRPQFLAVSGMIAALEQKPEDLRAISNELEASYADRVGCQLNVLRSYIALRLHTEGREFAERVADRVSNVKDASVVAGCLLHTGAIQSARDTAAHFVARFGKLDLGAVDDLRGVQTMAESFLEAGISDSDLRGFLDCALDSLDKQGWQTPTLQLNMPCGDRDDGPVAIARFSVGADDVEEILDVEDELMDDLIASNDRIFRDAAVVVAVLPHSSIE